MSFARLTKKEDPKEFQPLLWRLPYSLPGLLEEVRAEHFRHLPPEIPINVVTWQPLCCIVHMEPVLRTEPRIFVHELLNHVDTPVEVMRFVLKHELLHCVVRPRQVDGEMESHPPEFWRAERELGPEGPGVWRWVEKNLGRGIGHQHQGVFVKRSWKRIADSACTPYMPPLFPR